MIGNKQGHKIITIDLPITTHTRTHTRPPTIEDPCTSVSLATEELSESVGYVTSSCAVALSESTLLGEMYTCIHVLPWY